MTLKDLVALQDKINDVAEFYRVQKVGIEIHPKINPKVMFR